LVHGSTLHDDRCTAGCEVIRTLPMNQYARWSIMFRSWRTPYICISAGLRKEISSVEAFEEVFDYEMLIAEILRRPELPTVR
jgi:hypothetical protein